jgi:hypothetical protein
MFMPKDIGVPVQSGPVRRTELIREWTEESRRGSEGSIDCVLELGKEGTCLEVVRRDLEQNCLSSVVYMRAQARLLPQAIISGVSGARNTSTRDDLLESIMARVGKRDRLREYQR